MFKVEGYTQTLHKRGRENQIRILRMGNAYTCVIHPENLEAINRGEDFTDEQRYRWNTSIENGEATLRHGNNIFKISLEELNA